MYRMQTAELQHDQRQEEPSGQNGNKEILQVLQNSYITQRDEIIVWCNVMERMCVK